MIKGRNHENFYYVHLIIKSRGYYQLNDLTPIKVPQTTGL